MNTLHGAWFTMAGSRRIYCGTLPTQTCGTGCDGSLSNLPKYFDTPATNVGLHRGSLPLVCTWPFALRDLGDKNTACAPFQLHIVTLQKYSSPAVSVVVVSGISLLLLVEGREMKILLARRLRLCIPKRMLNLGDLDTLK